MNITYKNYKRLPRKISRLFPVLYEGMEIHCEGDEFCWAIMYEGDVVGCTYGTIEKIEIDKDGELRSEVCIFKFEVRKTWRKMGVGRALFNHIVEKYKPYKVTLNYLDIDAYNYWHHLGFKRVRGCELLQIKMK